MSSNQDTKQQADSDDTAGYGSVVIESEDGRRMEMQIINMFEVDDKLYAALAEAGSIDENAAVLPVVMRIDDDGEGNETMSHIADDAERKKVMNAWSSFMQQYSEETGLDESDEEGSA